MKSIYPQPQQFYSRIILSTNQIFIDIGRHRELESRTSFIDFSLSTGRGQKGQKGQVGCSLEHWRIFFRKLCFVGGI